MVDSFIPSRVYPGAEMTEVEAPSSRPATRKLHGDSTSQLLQLTVNDVGLKFTPTGKGHDDIRQLAVEAYNSQMITKILWQMCQDFTQAIDNAGDTIPEAFKAIVSAGILRARSNIDLGRK
jgi:hypothetical protein